MKKTLFAFVVLLLFSCEKQEEVLPEYKYLKVVYGADSVILRGVNADGDSVIIDASGSTWTYTVKHDPKGIKIY